MNWRNVDDDLPLTLKAEVWVGRNYVKVLILSFAVALLGIIFGFWGMSRNSSAVENLARTIAYMSDRVVVVTPDGRVAQIEKSELNQELLRIYLRNFVLSNLIFDKFSFVSGNTYAPSFEKILRYSEQVKRVLDMGAFAKGNPQGFRNYKATINYLWSLGRADELPEVIRPVAVVSEEFKYADRQFIYKADVDVAVSFFTTKKEWKAMRGTYTVEIAGYFSPLKGTPANPFGMKITNLKIVPIKKPRT